MAIVELDNLAKRYKGARTNAVDGVSERLLGILPTGTVLFVRGEWNR